jgi:uncharacterized phosphosugar-binding protein
MSKLTDSYLNSLIKLLERIRDEEAEVLEKAARMIADAIEGGQRIFGFGCTHSSLPIQDCLTRCPAG